MNSTWNDYFFFVFLNIRTNFVLKLKQSKLDDVLSFPSFHVLHNKQRNFLRSRQLGIKSPHSFFFKWILDEFQSFQTKSNLLIKKDKFLHQSYSKCNFAKRKITLSKPIAALIALRGRRSWEIKIQLFASAGATRVSQKFWFHWTRYSGD